MAKITIDLKKRDAIITTSIITLIGIIGIAIAYGTSSPQNFGHSAGELHVDIGGKTYTLQEAINQNLIGGSSGGSGGTIETGGEILIGSYDINIGTTSYQKLHLNYNMPSGIEQVRIKAANLAYDPYCAGGPEMILNNTNNYAITCDGYGGITQEIRTETTQCTFDKQWITFNITRPTSATTGNAGTEGFTKIEIIACDGRSELGTQDFGFFVTPKTARINGIRIGTTGTQTPSLVKV